MPKYENNKKHIAIMTRGTPITLRVASSKINIPIVPIINSIGIVYSPKAVSYTHLTLPTKRIV